MKMDVLKKVLREYTLIMGAVTAGLAMALGLGWIELEPEQFGLVMAFMATIFVLLRFVVTPIASPVLPVGTIVNANSTLPTSTVVEETPPIVG